MIKNNIGVLAGISSNSKEGHTTYNWLAFCFALLISCASPISATASVTFTAIGDLGGGTTGSRPYAISADGSIIVGTSRTGTQNSTTRGFVYQNGSMSQIPDLNVTTPSFRAVGVSSDGSVVVGETFVYQNGVTSSLPTGFRAYSVSDDGSTIVGYQGANAAYYKNGQTVLIDHLPGPSGIAEAYAVSSDGSVIVGWSEIDNGGIWGAEAFKFENGQVTGLGNLSTVNAEGVAYGVSANGDFIVGSSYNGQNYEAFVHFNGIMYGLGNFSEDLATFSEALDASSNGEILVGFGMEAYGSPTVAAIWELLSPGNYSMMSLADKLLALGLDISLDGWSSLEQIVAISDDGQTMTGYGTRNGTQEGFIVSFNTVVVPLPGAAWLFISAVASLFANKRIGAMGKAKNS